MHVYVIIAPHSPKADGGKGTLGKGFPGGFQGKHYIYFTI